MTCGMYLAQVSGDMLMNEDFMAIDTAPATYRKAYQPPRLSVLGDVSSLTESGSGNGNEAMQGFLGCTSNPEAMGPMC